MNQNFNALSVEQWLDSIATQLKTKLSSSDLAEAAMVGIYTGGVRVAQALQQRLQLSLPLGTLDISFYRDDFSHIGLQPKVKTSAIPFSLEGRDIILVDDVLYSGRTARAALNTLFDYGRPSRILLAVLVEREGHELPIRADAKGISLDLAPKQQIRLNQADLGLTLVDYADA